MYSVSWRHSCSPGSPTSGGAGPCYACEPLRQRLPNGLTILAEENHTAPVAALQVWVRVGSADELPGRLFGVEPEHFWELVARRRRLALCLGVRRSGQDDERKDSGDQRSGVAGQRHVTIPCGQSVDG